MSQVAVLARIFDECREGRRGGMRGNMKKAAEGLCILLKGILFTGFSVRIVLGLAWMCANFIEVQEFGQPQGFLYPLLLGVLGKVPQILYLLQLGLAGFAAYMLLKPIFPTGRLWRVWFVLAFMSLPMAMQCHLALLPYSFVSSLLILEFTCCRNVLAGEGGLGLRAIAGAGGCWIGLALLLSEYGWLGSLPLVFVLLVRLPRLCRNLRQLAYSVLLFAAFGGIVAGTVSLTRRAEDYERTFWFSMASRMTWPTVVQDSSRWPQELLGLLPEGVRWETSYMSSNMEKILQPTLEAAVGKEKAQEYYREMAEISFRLHKAWIVNRIGWDALIYAVPQAVLQEQLKGTGYDSYSGRNYEIMAMEHPVLTKHYVDYSCWWFAAALGGTVLFLTALKAAGRKLIKKGGVLLLAAYLVPVGGILTYYVMRGAGMADYRCTLAVSTMWTVSALFCMGKEQYI